MGYFDDIVEVKKDATQEANEMNRAAGNAFWFSIGALGMFLIGAALTVLFLFTSLKGLLTPLLCMVVGGVPFVFAIAFALTGILFGLKAQKSANMIRQKNSLKSIAIAYGLLWILLSIALLSVNLWLNIQDIIATL